MLECAACAYSNGSSSSSRSGSSRSPPSDDCITNDYAQAGECLQAPADRSRYTDVISGSRRHPAGSYRRRSDSAARAAHVLADRLVEAAEPSPTGSTGGWLPAGIPHARVLPRHRRGRLRPGRRRRTLNRSDLVDVATRGACALLAIGHHPSDWAVPLAIPPRPRGPAVSYGWCHGPAGTVRLFLLLNDIDPQPQWQHAIDACLQALRDSRLPIRLYPGYWDNLARCGHRGSRTTPARPLPSHPRHRPARLGRHPGRRRRRPCPVHPVRRHLVEHRIHQDPAGTAPRTRVHARHCRNRRLASQTPRPSHPPRYPAHPDQARAIMALTAYNPVRADCIPIRVSTRGQRPDLQR